MKKLLTVAILFAALFVFGLFVAANVSEAQSKNFVTVLLDLPAPPPFNPSIENQISNARGEIFFTRGAAPPDDAPIGDLIAYWEQMGRTKRSTLYVAPMSDKVAARLLAEIEKEPAYAYALLDALPEKPETANVVKRIYDKLIAEDADPDAVEESQDEERGTAVADNLKKWLTYNSDYFSDDLFKEARQSAETEEYVTNQDEVLALARIDWSRAQPLLERMLSNDAQPVSQTLARWAFYRRALAENDSSDVDRFREQLQRTVEDKSAKPGVRDLAMDALVREGDFSGRDDWYLSLLSDETLYDLRVSGSHYTGLTTIINQSPPDKWIGKMIELAGSDNKTVRSAAILNLATLVGERDERVVRALLPWLEHPEWARETNGQRRTLISALAGFQMPESVPGLIAALNEKATREMSEDGGTMSGMSNRSGLMTNTATVTSTNARISSPVEFFPYRSAAIQALVVQKDARAVPALRAILPQVENYERTLVVRALVASGGFTIAEQIEALEASVKMSAKMSEAMQAQNRAAAGIMSNAAVTAVVNTDLAVREVPPPPYTATGNYGVVDSMNAEDFANAYNPTDVKLILGNLLATQPDVSDELVGAVAARIGELERKNPQLAAALRRVLQNWSGAAVNSLLLRDLRAGKSDAGAVVKLLSVRRDLRDKQMNEIYELRGTGANASASGIAACLLEDANVYDQTLNGATVGAEEKTAMLACARMVRARLPVAAVAENLRAADKQLALAAERYLESEDSPEARRIVLSMHPNEAKILGATNAFNVGDGAPVGDGEVNRFLPALFASVGDGEHTAPVVPYYLLFLNPNELRVTEKLLQKEIKEDDTLVGVYAYDKNFVRIYKDKAVFSWEEDEARFRERTLDAAEFNNLKSLLAARRADEMTPYLAACDSCQNKELLMLGRAGGRRVFYRSPTAPEFFAELDKIFSEMRAPRAELHYYLEKQISGLEVLFADDNLNARAAWKNADDFRVLIDDRARRRQIDKELRKLDRLDSEKEDYDYEKGEQTQEKRRRLREYENFAWRKLERAAPLENRLGGVIAQPPPLEYIPARDNNPLAERGEEQWKARTTAGAEIRTGETDGIYKIANRRTTKIRAGNYGSTVVTPDGRWASVTKFDDENGPMMMRVNLLNGKEFKVNVEQPFRLKTLAYDAAIGKFLIGYNNDGEYGGDYYGGRSDGDGTFFLLDAETGALQTANGEVRPLAQQTFRPLQPTATADEFWAAIPDVNKNETRVGIYNQKTLSFKLRLTVPRIKFDSMDLWADERENKIYFVYEGHLLALPLPKS